MAILEITLEKPALVEEYRLASDAAERSAATPTRETSSGGVKGKLLGLLAAVVGVALLVWRLKNRGNRGGNRASERGPEPEIGADGTGNRSRKVTVSLGLVAVVVGLAIAVQKRRG